MNKTDEQILGTNPPCTYFLIDGAQVLVLPQSVQHLSCCLHHLHGVPEEEEEEVTYIY